MARRDRLAVDAVAEAARQAFARMTATAPGGVAFAPGRVNLIGEHTDYNDGFVLPMAIEEGIAAAFGPRSDRVLRVHAADYGQTEQIALDDLVRPIGSMNGWFRYAAGVAWAMQSEGMPLKGADIATAANLPSDAGLSSSAAFELVVARALGEVAGLPWDPSSVATMSQKAEHAFADVACGIMDQMAVACARAGAALLLDCRSLDIRHLPLPPSARIVIIDTGVRRSLSASAYNDRRAACEQAVAALRELQPSVCALRDVDLALLERARPLMDDATFRRALHVVCENARPWAFAGAIALGDLAGAGRIMIESHRSLRDLYEVSCRELDALVAMCTVQQGCYGARLTGAGFGGCAIALVDAGASEAFCEAVLPAYESATGLRGAVIQSRPAEGVRLLSLI